LNSKKNDEPKELSPIQEYAMKEGLDLDLVEQIEHEILSDNTHVSWSDIIGLDEVKDLIFENIIYPMKRPDIFQGLRESSRGILLFGPPGTGKTMIG
jgi:SpoVK/Ycf46/Vps4 family AAA+-type ATPase